MADDLQIPVPATPPPTQGQGMPGPKDVPFKFTNDPDPDLMQGETQAEQQGAVSPTRQGFALGLGALSAKFLGNALGGMVHDKTVGDVASKAYTDYVAPGIIQRWHQQDAEAFHALVAKPYADQATKAFQMYQHRVAQLDQGILEQPDGGIVQIDPNSDQARRIREGFTMQMLNTTQALDSQIIQASTHPKWSGNPIIEGSVKQLMDHRIGFGQQFQKAHMDAIEEESKRAGALFQQREAARQQAETERLQAMQPYVAQQAQAELREKGLLGDETAMRIQKMQQEMGGLGSLPKDPAQWPNFFMTDPRGQEMISGRANTTARQLWAQALATNPDLKKAAGDQFGPDGKERPQYNQIFTDWAVKNRGLVMTKATGQFMSEFNANDPQRIDDFLQQHPSARLYLQSIGYGAQPGTTQTAPPKTTAKVEAESDRAKNVKDGLDDLGNRLEDDIKNGRIPQPKSLDELSQSPAVMQHVHDIANETYGPNPSAAKNAFVTVMRQQATHKILRDVKLAEYSSEGNVSDWMTKHRLGGILHPAGEMGEQGKPTYKLPPDTGENAGPPLTLPNEVEPKLKGRREKPEEQKRRLTSAAETEQTIEDQADRAAGLK